MSKNKYSFVLMKVSRCDWFVVSPCEFDWNRISNLMMKVNTPLLDRLP